MMRVLRHLLAAALLAGAAPRLPGAQEAPTPPAQRWSFDGPFGSFDLAAAQRGFQVYSEVCSVCHSLQYLHYRDLEGIGLTDGADQGDRRRGHRAAGDSTTRASRRKGRGRRRIGSNRPTRTSRRTGRPITAPCRRTCR